MTLCSTKKLLKSIFAVTFFVMYSSSQLNISKNHVCFERYNIITEGKIKQQNMSRAHSNSNSPDKNLHPQGIVIN